MKKFVSISISALALLVLLSGCGRKACDFIGCRNDAAMFKDYCSSHQGIVDGARGLIDGLFGG